MEFLDSWSRADFYFPLDCDEFLAVELEPYKLAFDRSSIESALSKWIGFQGALMIGSAYDNHPRKNGIFARTDQQRKTFFAEAACIDLDHGFHEGHGKSGERERTSISYLHFHYRPFEEYCRAALQKVEPFMRAIGTDSLEEFGQRGQPGLHLVPTLLAKSADEYAALDESRYEALLSVEEHFRSMGMTTPYFDSKS